MSVSYLPRGQPIFNSEICKIMYILVFVITATWLYFNFKGGGFELYLNDTPFFNGTTEVVQDPRDPGPSDQGVDPYSTGRPDVPPEGEAISTQQEASEADYGITQDQADYVLGYLDPLNLLHTPKDSTLSTHTAAGHAAAGTFDTDSPTPHDPVWNANCDELKTAAEGTKRDFWMEQLGCDKDDF